MGEGKGDVDGDGNGEGEGKSEGEGNGEGKGEGEGNGSPTCITVRGASGFRRERRVEGTLDGAIGCGSWRIFTSSRFGKTPSGAPVNATPFCWDRPMAREKRFACAIANGAT